MKVLHVVTLHTPTGEFGGPTRVALNLSLALRGRGHEVSLMALGGGFPGPLPSLVDGVPTRLFRERTLVPGVGVAGRSSFALLAAARRAVREVDVVHVHLLRDLVTLPVALAAISAGTPLVLQTHGMVDPTQNRLARVIDSLAMRRVLDRADAVAYLTGPERDGLLAVAGDPVSLADRLVRLVNGVTSGERRPTPAAPPVIVFAARLQERKRPQDFVRAIPEVLRRLGPARFVLAGPDGGELADTLRLADELGVREVLDHVGPLTHAEVLELYARSSVYVLPSVNEPFPLSVLEALSVGVPVVLTGSNGLADDVARSGAGRVVTGAEQLAAAIVELADREVGEAASRAGWALVRDVFSIGAVAERLEEIYARVLGTRAQLSAARPGA